MALISLPVSLEKGSPQSYSLNLTELFLLVSDSYYKNISNISKIILMYYSSSGSQRESITFLPDGLNTTLESSAFFAPEAFDDFDVAFITIIDKQNGKYVVASSSIPDISNYSLAFNAPSPGLLFTRDFVAQNSPTSNELLGGSYGPSQPLEFVDGVGLKVNSPSLNYFGFLYDMNLPSGTYTLRISYTVNSFTETGAFLRFLNTPSGDMNNILYNSTQYVGGGISNIPQGINTTNAPVTDISSGVKTYDMTILVNSGDTWGSVRIDGSGSATGFDMSIQKIEVFSV